MQHYKIIDDVKWIGQITNMWDVGKYTFYEYREKDFDTKKITNNLRYGCYIDNKSIHHSYSSLEEAMIHVICEPSIGPNEASVIIRLITSYISKKS